MKKENISRGDELIFFFLSLSLAALHKLGKGGWYERDFSVSEGGLQTAREKEKDEGEVRERERERDRRGRISEEDKSA